MLERVTTIQREVATYFDVKLHDLKGPKRHRAVAHARMVAMYLARKLTNMSFPEIGRFMGNKNHSTVILATRKIREMVERDALVSRQTPAGLKDERLVEIIQALEEQLGKVVQGVNPRPEVKGLTFVEAPRVAAVLTGSSRAAV